MVELKKHVAVITMDWEARGCLSNLTVEYNTFDDSLNVKVEGVGVKPEDIKHDTDEMNKWFKPIIHAIIYEKGLHNIEENIRGSIIINATMHRFTELLRFYEI